LRWFLDGILTGYARNALLDKQKRKSPDFSGLSVLHQTVLDYLIAISRR
jgi:hypothetical protein